MLLHLNPKIFTRMVGVELLELRIEPLGLLLRGTGPGADLVLRQPYPNKRYRVACRKEGRRAMNGILIDVPKIPSGGLKYTARWSLFCPGSKDIIGVQRIHYTLLDSEFDAASDSMGFWYGYHGTEFASRWPAWAKGLAPNVCEPRMTFEQEESPTVNTQDEFNETTGFVRRRTQAFAMPTIEKARFEMERSHGERMPQEATAFRV